MDPIAAQTPAPELIMPLDALRGWLTAVACGLLFLLHVHGETPYVYNGDQSCQFFAEPEAEAVVGRMVRREEQVEMTEWESGL